MLEKGNGDSPNRSGRGGLWGEHRIGRSVFQRKTAGNPSVNPNDADLVDLT
jgi:hypothetical protein